MRIHVCCMATLLCLISWSASAFQPAEETVEIKVVQKNTLYFLCQKYLNDPEQWRKIASINHLANPNLILPGQTLKMPVDALKGVPVDGIVTFIKGDVTFKEREKAEWRTFHLQDPVKEGNVIRTGEDSAVEITAEDGTTVLLRANTVLYVQTAKKTLTLYLRSLYLRTGRMVSRIKAATGREPRYEIRTPSAVAAARGTDYRVSVDDRNATRSEVIEGTVEVAGQKEKISVKAGEGTIVKMNEAPSPPRKLLPPPEPVSLESLYRAMPLKFHYNKVEGAHSYRCMLTRDRDGKDIVKEKIIRPDETLDIVGVDDGTYYLRTLSIDTDGLEGLLSGPESVKVRVNPLPPLLEAPVNDSRLRARNVEIRWLKVKDAVRYHLQIAEDAEFRKITLNSGDITNTVFTTAELDYRPYFFRMSSVAEDGYEGIWSVVQRFTIIPPPPVPPVERPQLNEQEITLRWGNLGSGVTYQVQMAKDEEFEEIIADNRVDKPEMSLQKPEEDGTYYIRIRGIDAEGYAGSFSSPQSLVIASTVLPMVLGVLGTIGGVALILFLAL
jgi:hypothetical protein